MIKEEKKEYILNKLTKNNILNIKELSKELNCTDASIRYIVNDLAKKKLLTRVHGGIVKNEETVVDISERILKTKKIKEKEEIADIALKYISDNSTIILDSGTTNLMLAKKIKNFKNLNIITNSIKIASILLEKHNENINIIIIGGIIRPLTNSIVNHDNSNTIKNLKANQLYLNIGAISVKEGLTDPNYQEAIIKRNMLEIAHEAILLCDSSKIEKISIAHICPIERLDRIITDKNVDKKFIEQVEKLNVEIIYAGRLVN